MKIVYGVSGEGLGHVFEALEIAEALRGDGHELKVLTYGERALDVLRPFGPTEIRGLPLYFDERGLSIGRTAAMNAGVLPFYLRHGRRLHREVADFGPDVFLTAYEPFTTLLAHLRDAPLVSMDNQTALIHLRPQGGFSAARAVAALATRAVTWGADYYLVKSFQRPKTAPDHVRFVAPVVQRGIRALTPSEGGHVLVYLTKPNPALLEVLAGVEQRFVVYDGSGGREQGNLSFRPRGEGFVRDLASCRAILGTAGFSLMADAIYLGKPYFAVPLKKQYEQTMNAIAIAEAGFGEWEEEPTREHVREFLDELPRYRLALANRRFNPNEQEDALREALARVVRAARTGGTPAPTWGEAVR